ncbi:hypothetical protein G7Y89_g13389 [Cudoniella acicularis]|uniref:DNA-directed RNA polymerase n=1 Tax=Cudoniella acicularis TaxID=354080 RepID=A0A8H4R707_9HELO|nr:hypothetical protein G7Y89_g13389 [Cudoniella acicularis]
MSCQEPNLFDVLGILPTIQPTPADVQRAYFIALSRVRQYANPAHIKVRPANAHCVGECIFVSVTNGIASTSSSRGVAAKMKLSLDSGASDLLRVQHLKRQIPQIFISGYQGARRVLIETSENTGNTVLVGDYGIRPCMTTEGVVSTKTTSDSVMEALSVLGIEAARTTITTEIAKVTRDMNIDPRHMQLFADVMTYKGEVLGIT